MGLRFLLRWIEQSKRHYSDQRFNNRKGQYTFDKEWPFKSPINLAHLDRVSKEQEKWFRSRVPSYKRNIFILNSDSGISNFKQGVNTTGIYTFNELERPWNIRGRATTIFRETTQSLLKQRPTLQFFKILPSPRNNQHG